MEKIHVFHPDALLENLTDIKIRYSCDQSNWFCRLFQQRTGTHGLEIVNVIILDEMCERKKKWFVTPITVNLGVEQSVKMNVAMQNVINIGLII